MNKKPSPDCLKALEKYQELKIRLCNHFLRGEPLQISNNSYMASYTAVYDLINSTRSKLENEKHYQSYERTLSNIFQADLKSFCEEIRKVLLECKFMSPENHLSVFCRQLTKYTRFLYYTYRSFMVIEKHSKEYVKTSLHHQGLTILKNEIIVPLYDTLFDLFYDVLEMYKKGQPIIQWELEFLIQLVGTCGFTKFKSIKLDKYDYSEYQFASFNQETSQKVEVQYETDFFKVNFTNKIVRKLREKYKKISDDIIQLSTSEYVIKSLTFLSIEERTAELFYPTKSVKTLILSCIQQVLINDKCETLINNPKTGLSSMLDSQDIDGLKAFYQFLKITSHQKLLAKSFQNYIEGKVTTQFLEKITPDDEKVAKKEVVIQFINNLFDFYNKIEKISSEIIKDQKDSGDLILSSSQSLGFQSACNKNSVVCNFLVYYVDYVLKKAQIGSTESNLSELILKVNKITKFLYSMDSFLKFYQKLLGVRILYDTFKNKETEFEIINMLKNEVGLNSMNKITAMVNDYKFSDSFNNQRIPQLKNKVHFNFQVMTLTSGCWQIQDQQYGRSRVPPELMTAVQLYEEEYNTNLPGRLLTWIFNYGRAILHVKFNKSRKALIVNNYQLLILLFFQRMKFSVIKVSQLISEMKPEDEPAFLASLISLAKTGVLIKEKKSDRIQSKDEKFQFNINLDSPHPKIGCYTIPRFTQKAAGQKGSNSELQKERSNLVDAAIVKIMKSKRVLSYKVLVEEVTEVPSILRMFKPSLGLIKQRIQNCIEREFLERDPTDRGTLLYKP